MKASLYYLHKKTQQVKLTFDMIARATKFITRADDRTKTIGNKNTKFLIHAIEQELEANGRKPVFIDHDFMMKITDCLNDQNAILLKRLSDIFDAQYKHCIRYKGKLSHRGYMVCYTETGRERLENPELFYDINNELKQQKAKILRPIKIGASTDKNRCTTYKEKEIEDSSFRAISSISREKIKNKKFSQEIETSSIAALPTLRGSSNDEFLSYSPNEVATIATAPTAPLVPPITPPTAEQEREQLKAHQTRRQETVSDEPKPLGATILLLLPKRTLEANSVTNTHQKWVEFQLKIENSKDCSTLECGIASRVTEEIQVEDDCAGTTIGSCQQEPTNLDEESRRVLAERAERKAVWQRCLSRVADSMGETYDPITCKMREVTLEDMQLQFDRAEYRIDLEEKRIRLQAKSELWVPAFEMVYSAKFKEAATEACYSFELVRTLGEKR